MIMNQAAALRVRWKGRADLSPCVHRDLTLKGRYLRWKGIDLKRALERYNCNGSDKPLVLQLKLSFHTDPLRLHAPPCGLIVLLLEWASLRGPYALLDSLLRPLIPLSNSG